MHPYKGEQLVRGTDATAVSSSPAGVTGVVGGGPGGGRDRIGWGCCALGRAHAKSGWIRFHTPPVCALMCTAFGKTRFCFARTKPSREEGEPSPPVVSPRAFPLVPLIPGGNLGFLLPEVKSPLRSLEELVLVFVSLGVEGCCGRLEYGCGTSWWMAEAQDS